MGEYTGFAAQVKEQQEANAAEKAGIFDDALRTVAAQQAQIALHLRRTRTLARLVGVAPPLQAAAVNIIVSMYHLTGERLMVVSGVRGDKEQAELYAQGRTKPGKIVTQIDGVKARSNHQVATQGPWKGLGCAVDFCFVDEDDAPSWADMFPWGVLGVLVKASGLLWGGDWQRFPDRPHAELRQP